MQRKLLIKYTQLRTSRAAGKAAERKKMDAGTISVMKLAQTRSDWAIGFAKNVKDVMKQEGEALVEMIEKSTAAMERSVNPHLGGNIDVRL